MLDPHAVTILWARLFSDVEVADPADRLTIDLTNTVSSRSD